MNQINYINGSVASALNTDNSANINGIYTQVMANAGTQALFYDKIFQVPRFTGGVGYGPLTFESPTGWTTVPYKDPASPNNVLYDLKYTGPITANPYEGADWTDPSQTTVSAASNVTGLTPSEVGKPMALIK